jgi:hypothetical protein
MYSMTRLKVLPPPDWQQQLVAALAATLSTTTSSSSSSSSSRVRHTFSGRDLCLLLWALPGLRLAPPAGVITGMLKASRRHLSRMDCSYLTALLVRRAADAQRRP